MALKSELMASGMPAAQASKLGFDPVTAYTAAGTTQATATSLTANCANVTTSSASAGVVIARTNEWNFIYNSGPQVLTIYPQSGGTFLGLAKNAGFQLAANKPAIIAGDGNTLIYNIGA